MIQPHTPDVEKMYTYLRGYFIGAQLQQSLIALQYMREKHAHQTRKNGIPYVVHPLSMACYAVALGLRDDNIIATILLHDVVEDCDTPVHTLPVNDTIKVGVKYMTVTKFSENEPKVITKRRYFNELLESKEATIVKALDRYNNLTDMAFALSDDAIGKNAAETELLLLPIMKQAKEKWVELNDILFVLRTNISSVNDILKLKYEKEYNKWIQIYQQAEKPADSKSANPGKDV